MRDTLVDLVKQTAGLIDTIKITGTPSETRFQAVDENKTVFIEGVLKEAIPEFEGEFGVTNLNLLKGLLEFSSYRTDQASFNVKRRPWKETTTVEQFEFRDANGVGSNFRAMSPDLVPEQAEIRSLPWDVTFVPNKGKLAEFAQLAKLYSEVNKTFGATTDGSNLMFYIGEENSSTHRGSMVFESGVSGVLRGDLLWTTSQFLQIMNLAGDKVSELKITSRGVLNVAVETPHAMVNYYLRASRG
jgi:hypothetical protein